MTIIVTTRDKRFDIDAMKATDFEVEDIAHSLSQQCRYNGNTPEFYSVAEHVVYCARFQQARLLEREELEIANGGQPWGDEANTYAINLIKATFHHDDGEFAIGDIIRPVKRLVDNIVAIEDDILEVIYDKFGITELSGPDFVDVKKADDTMWHLEAKWFFPWWTDIPPVNDRIGNYLNKGRLAPGLEPKEAYATYMQVYAALDNQDWRERF